MFLMFFLSPALKIIINFVIQIFGEHINKNQSIILCGEVTFIYVLIFLAGKNLNWGIKLKYIKVSYNNIWSRIFNQLWQFEDFYLVPKIKN